MSGGERKSDMDTDSMPFQTNEFIKTRKRLRKAAEQKWKKYGCENQQREDRSQLRPPSLPGSRSPTEPVSPCPQMCPAGCEEGVSSHPGEHMARSLASSQHTPWPSTGVCLTDA